MKKWFIADTHFSHANIIKYANRPFANVEEMDCVLIENWNLCVAEDDQVFFLGNVGLGSVQYYATMLPITVAIVCYFLIEFVGLFLTP